MFGYCKTAAFYLIKIWQYVRFVLNVQ